jgi:hypothetical protein
MCHQSFLEKYVGWALPTILINRPAYLAWREAGMATDLTRAEACGSIWAIASRNPLSTGVHRCPTL